MNTDSGYAFVAVIEYGKKGNIESTTFLTHEKDNSSQALNELARSDPGEYLRDYYYYSGTFQPPQDRIYCFAMTKTALEAYSDYDPSILYANSALPTDKAIFMAHDGLAPSHTTPDVPASAFDSVASTTAFGSPMR